MKEPEPVGGMVKEASCWPLSVFQQVGELDAVIGEHGVNAIRTASTSVSRKAEAARISARSTSSTTANFDVRSDGYKQVELSFAYFNLGQANVEEAFWIGVVLLPARLVPLDLRQTADAMSLHKSMKRRAS